MAGVVDPTKPAKFPVILSDALLGGTAKDIFTNIRYNHKPDLPSDSPAQARLRPSTAGSASSYDLSFQDADGGKYAYAGTRSTENRNQYVLVFDPSRRAFVLDRVDSSFNMNLTRTPDDSNPESLAKDFAHLDTAITVDTGPVEEKASTSSSSSSNLPASTSPESPPLAATATAATTTTTTTAKGKTKGKAAPKPAAPKATKKEAPRRKTAPTATAEKKKSSNKKKEEQKPTSMDLPMPAAAPASSAAPERLRGEQEQPNKSRKKRAHEDDEDDEDEDDDLDVLEVVDPSKKDSGDRGDDFSPAFPKVTFPMRRFSEFAKNLAESENEGSIDGDDVDDADLEFKLPSPVGSRARTAGAGAGADEEEDEEGEDLEDAIEVDRNPGPERNGDVDYYSKSKSLNDLEADLEAELNGSSSEKADLEDDLAAELDKELRQGNGAHDIESESEVSEED